MFPVKEWLIYLLHSTAKGKWKEREFTLFKSGQYLFEIWNLPNFHQVYDLLLQFCTTIHGKLLRKE